MGKRISGPLTTLTLTGAGVGGVLTNAGTAWLNNGQRAILRKIMWRNASGVNSNLLVGYGDLTAPASLFRQTLPSILMVNGVDGELGELELPIGGNTPEGFFPDTTLVTGSNGNIMVEADSAVVAVQVRVEVELI